MKTTLQLRIREAMKGPPAVSVKALARACGVASPSVTGWRTGKTKSLEGSHLLAAAKLLGVRAQWLANGTGAMREGDVSGPSLDLAVGPSASQLTTSYSDLALRIADWFDQVRDVGHVRISLAHDIEHLILEAIRETEPKTAPAPAQPQKKRSLRSRAA